MTERGDRRRHEHAPRAATARRHRGADRAAHNRGERAHRARLGPHPDAVDRSRARRSRGDERRGPRGRAGRPARRAGPAGARLRHLGLLARGRDERAGRLGQARGWSSTSAPATCRSAICRSRSATSISSTRRRARRAWRSRRMRRDRRATASSSSPGVPGHTAPVSLDGEAVMRDLVLENQLLYGTVNAGPPAFDAAIADLGKFEAPVAGAGARSSSPATTRPRRSPRCSPESPGRSRA